MLLPLKCKGPAASGYAQQTADHCSREFFRCSMALPRLATTASSRHKPAISGLPRNNAMRSSVSIYCKVMQAEAIHQDAK